MWSDLPKVSRAPHLGHKLHEELKTGVSEDARQQAIDGADEIGRRQTGVVLDGRVISVLVWRDGCRVDGAYFAAERVRSCLLDICTV